eukprot:scaffold3111_cov14-Tisochrysis_lutea.AAC.1
MAMYGDKGGAMIFIATYKSTTLLLQMAGFDKHSIAVQSGKHKGCPMPHKTHLWVRIVGGWYQLPVQ